MVLPGTILNLFFAGAERIVKLGRSTGVSDSRSEDRYHTTLVSGLWAFAPCSERTNGPPFHGR